MLSKTFDDIGSDAGGAYMFQRASVIDAKKNSVCWHTSLIKFRDMLQ